MVIITTVGTSLLTNRISSDVTKCFGDLSNSDNKKISKGSLLKSNNGLDTKISGFIKGDSSKECEVCNISASYQINLNASAEIKSICAIANGPSAKVYLLCTDTFMSEYAAQQIQKALDGKNGLTFIDTPCRIPKLSLENADDFQEAGFDNLLEKINQIYESEGLDEKNKRNKTAIILNISGGYKALIPFLTIYGQLRKLPINYIYENSDILISISPLPLNYDWTILESLRPYLKKTELNLDDFGKKQQIVIQELLRNFLIKKSKDNFFSITVLGKILIEEFHSSNLRNNVLGSFLEYKYFEYFTRKGCNVTIGNHEFELPYSYSYNSENLSLSIAFDDIKKYSNKSKSGDIDLIIRKNDEVSIAEIKNYFTVLSYSKKINKYKPSVSKASEEDYYRQIKSKIEAYYFNKKELPKTFLFLINLLLFEKDSKDYTSNTELIKTLNHFQKRINKDYNGQIAFIAKICTFNYTKEQNLKVNYNNLLKRGIGEDDFQLVKL